MMQLREQLNELIEAARSGHIIPVRLPGQLEALAELVDEAEEQHKEAVLASKPAAGSPEEIVHENAEFFKTAIHELRTPMTSIRGYADMLNNPAMVGELSDMQRQLLEVIRANSRRMESLLSDMSAINKLRAGILPVNQKMDMFKNVAMMAEKQTRPIAEELKRQLEFEIPQGLPILTTDGEHLATAMVKLIENGLRYTDESGKVTVTGTADGNELVITVADNGIGMHEHEVARLGELFFRADHDVVRNYKGSGLGIPIAYGLLDAIGCNYTVESTPDEGTCFTLRLEGMT
jgi:signal transduction histidine kinase